MYTVGKLKKIDADKIMTWKYEAPYNFYNMTDDQETLKELMDGTYFSAYNQDEELVGYFCYGKNAQVPAGTKANLYSDDSLLDIGLGLRPDLTGKGYGTCFLNKGMAFAENKYDIKGFRLSVATFNQRAATLYNQVGFVPKGLFVNKSGKTEVEFLVMEKLANGETKLEYD